MSVLRDAVVAATQGTPYTVAETKKGFVVKLDLANAQWWGLFNRAGLRTSFSWKVTECARKKSFTIFDRKIRVTWSAGVPGFSGQWQGQGGRIPTLTREKIWALSDRGRIEPVVDYRLNSREGRDLIRMVAKQQGYKERLPLSLKGALFMALLTPAFWAVYGIVVLVHRLLGMT